MRLAWITAALVLAVVTQSAIGLVFPSRAWVFDPFLLVVVYCGLAWGETPGLLVGAVAGWIQDIQFGGSVLGLSALALLLIGFAVGAAASRLLLVSATARMLVLFTATLADGLILQWLGAIFDLGLEPMHGFDLLLRAATNALLGAAVFEAIERRTRREVRR